MGSVSRQNRCDRFRKHFEDQLVSKSPHQVGDWLEVICVTTGMAEDGTEVSKFYVTVRNKRTGDEDVMTFDDCLYDPEGQDEDNVERAYRTLYPGYMMEKDHKKSRASTIKMLKKAELINPKYKEKR